MSLLPDWPQPRFLNDELERVAAREISARPLHGVPSAYRETIERIEIQYKWDDGDFVVFVMSHICEISDALGKATCHLRGRSRDRAIERVLYRLHSTKDEERTQVRALVWSICREVV